MIGKFGIGRRIRKNIVLRRASAVSTHTTKNEREKLFDLVCALPVGSKVLEIGSYLGASTLCLAAAVKEIQGHLYCVDTWMNQTMPEGELDTFEKFRLNTSKYSKWITPIRKSSADLNRNDIPTQIKFVFLDGDHSYDMVKNDFMRANEFIDQKAIVAFHDLLYFDGVSRFVGECLITNQWRIYGVIDNLGWLKKL